MSFVLRREAKLSPPGSAPESPKLWRPGNASSVPKKPASPPKSEASPTPPARTTEDLFNFYETMHTTSHAGGQDLSLKDIVERTKKPSQKGVLRTLRERDDQEPGGGDRPNQQHHRHEVPPRRQRGPLKTVRERDSDHPSGGPEAPSQQQQHHHHHRRELNSQAKPKANVPAMADGETIHSHRNRRQFGEFLDNSKSNASDSFLNAMHRSPEPSPRRSKSVTSVPNMSPSRSPRPFYSESSPNRSFPTSNHTAARSPLRSPIGSPLLTPARSPHRRVSPLASSSYPPTSNQSPRRPSFGDPEMGRRNSKPASPSEWMPPPPSPPRRSSVGASPLGEAPRSSVGDGQFRPRPQVLADLFKATGGLASAAATAPLQQKEHPSMHCSTCSTFTLFKTRCLVCGNIYCRNCVKDAMKNMPEGRKCVSCLGKPIHNKYLSEAGNGCFCFVSSAASAAEMKWARQRPAYYDNGVSSASRRNGTQNTTPRSSTQSAASKSSAASTTNLLPPHRSKSAHSQLPGQLPPHWISAS